MRRALIISLSGLLLLGACGGNDKKSSNASASKGSTSTSAAADASSTTAPVGGAAGGSATTARRGSSGGGGSGGGSATPAAQPSTPAGQKAAAPGNYSYAVTGTSTTPFSPTPQPVNGTASLKVDALQGTDQHSLFTGPDGGTTDQVLRYLADGVYLVDIKTSTSGLTKEFRPNPPGLSFPQPATVGKTWSWTATSTDGKTTLKGDFKVARTETATAGTESVPTVVIEATITLTGDINATSHRTIWVSEAYRMIIRTDDKTDGTYQTFHFASDTSQKLQSTKPS